MNFQLLVVSLSHFFDVVFWTSISAMKLADTFLLQVNTRGYTYSRPRVFVGSSRILLDGS